MLASFLGYFLFGSLLIFVFWIGFQGAGYNFRRPILWVLGGSVIVMVASISSISLVKYSTDTSWHRNHCQTACELVNSDRKYADAQLCVCSSGATFPTGSNIYVVPENLEER